MPIPPVFDVDERIRELEQARDPNSPFYEREEFWPNIPTLIKLYKEGKMPDPNVAPTYLRDGKVITREEYLADPYRVWVEIIPGSGLRGQEEQLAQKEFYTSNDPTRPGRHMLRTQLRMDPARGGNGQHRTYRSAKRHRQQRIELIRHGYRAAGRCKPIKGGLPMSGLN
ncbi:hypothetical protein FQN50_008978 [Emmonsiellopsis sp. PD_5]|nr:hypothetical protein FQN50_008978 [Emmonsiellopsis sp. PD_5]